LDFEHLLKAAELGEISDSEIQRVIEKLSSGDRDTDRFTLLQILGEAGVKSSRSLVEKFLECPEDPMLSRLALEVLCLYWGEAHRYVSDVHRFIVGVHWDRESDVRQMAILLAGHYLRSNSDSFLLGELVSIVEDTNERALIRGDAYLALGRAMGLDWNELPAATKNFDVALELDPSLLKRAKTRLMEEEQARGTEG
jgi:hypothetical protein